MPNKLIEAARAMTVHAGADIYWVVRENRMETFKLSSISTLEVFYIR